MDIEEKKQLTIRLDQTLFEKVERLAKQENRKIGPQIEYMLKKYLEIKES
ncbi:MAG: hypothetical protein ACOYEB_12665 [Enterococcus lemanii]